MMTLLLAVWMALDVPPTQEQRQRQDLPLREQAEPVYADHARTEILVIFRNEGCLRWTISLGGKERVCAEFRYIDVWTIDDTLIRVDRLKNKVKITKREKAKGEK